MEFIPLVVMLALVKSLVDLARRAMAKDFNPVGVQVLSYLVGVGVALLFSKTAWAATLVFGGVSLATAGIATVVVVGLAIAASANVTADTLAALTHKKVEGEAPLVIVNDPPTVAPAKK